jgi:hypothetical protein
MFISGKGQRQSYQFLVIYLSSTQKTYNMENTIDLRKALRIIGKFGKTFFSTYYLYVSSFIIGTNITWLLVKAGNAILMLSDFLEKRKWF